MRIGVALAEAAALVGFLTKLPRGAFGEGSALLSPELGDVAELWQGIREGRTQAERRGGRWGRLALTAVAYVAALSRGDPAPVRTVAAEQARTVRGVRSSVAPNVGPAVQIAAGIFVRETDHRNPTVR